VTFPINKGHLTPVCVCRHSSETLFEDTRIGNSGDAS